MGKIDLTNVQLEKSLFGIVAVPVILGRTAAEFLLFRKQFRPRFVGSGEEVTETFPIASPLAYLAMALVIPGIITYLVSHAMDEVGSQGIGLLLPHAISDKDTVSEMINLFSNPTIQGVGLIGIYAALISAYTGLLMTVSAYVCRVRFPFLTSWSLAAYAGGTFALIFSVTQITMKILDKRSANGNGNYFSEGLIYSPGHLGIAFFLLTGQALLAFAYAHQLRMAMGIGRLRCLGVLAVFSVITSLVSAALNL